MSSEKLLNKILELFLKAQKNFMEITFVDFD